MGAQTKFFGIRHHGPGCARSLLRALEETSPDCLLIEGPPEAEAVLSLVLDGEMEPPVSLLCYCPEDTSLASFYPFTVFSPEWQAVKYGLAKGIPVRFIDLPQVHDLALRKEDKLAVTMPSPESGPVESETPEAASEDAMPTENAVAGEEKSEDTGEPEMEDPGLDPLDWLGRAAGYDDGESWWNHLVEERRDGDSAGLFAAIQEAMTTVRTDVPRRMTERAARREALREAHMRKCLRAAEKEDFKNIAVVCGAWHVPALATMPAAKADNDLLKGLPKVKVTATWAPWTYGRLTTASGYGAGVLSPGWYEFLWKCDTQDGGARAIGWISKVARLLREEDIDCSSAHVIEAARLAETIAAMSERPHAGLGEINEAIRAVMCMGESGPLALIHRKLVVSERMGRVPPGVPAVPLQQDLEKQQRSLRMKPEAPAKELDLDLRNENDLARSHLLHRLSLLGIKWGEVRGTGRSAKGTFHEVWQLQWQPEFAISIIEASRWGQTIVDAAAALALDKAQNAGSLPELSALVDRVLLANLPQAIAQVTQALENFAAVAGDTSQLLDAIPPLANIFRYGNVRQTDASLVGHVLDGLVSRACIGLSGACASLDDDAAAAMRKRILGAHQAIKLIGKQEHLENWLPALGRIAVLDGSHGLVEGLAARIRFDERADDLELTEQRMSQALSIGHDPAPAAAWLEGFLQQSGMVLLHDDRLWQTVNGWVASLHEEHFTRILPLVRRTFALFPGTERQQLGERAKQRGGGSASTGAAHAAATTDLDWNLERAQKPIPVLRQILGLPSQ
ncbi:DUF5682 family protein [Roseimicrobium sp. ORNL1]|uniref:DUF5682 family protein n=1 Tax=Roseimicrobium sp. ORNL1 TaxID=2711231 RepID=UPI0013E1377C|nr:DUF5682 family protein [Roseimicrobium sp. ORNL1]QIF03534.1 hypothetical protein G5S37_19055 [Roseimicrobium sp. ORNL1]